MKEPFQIDGPSNANRTSDANIKYQAAFLKKKKQKTALALFAARGNPASPHNSKVDCFAKRLATLRGFLVLFVHKKNPSSPCLIDGKRNNPRPSAAVEIEIISQRVFPLASHPPSRK